MKKITAILLVFTMLVGCLPLAFAEEGITAPIENENAEPLYDNGLPLVILAGMEFAGLVKDKGLETEENALGSVETSDIVKMIFKTIWAVISKFSINAGIDVVTEFVSGMFKYLACDGNGDSIYNVEFREYYDKSMAHYPEYYAHKGGANETGIVRDAVDTYGPERVYYIRYDWRLDPRETAVFVNQMVELAKSEHNVDQVNFVCCSMGGVVALNYINTYGSASLKNLVFNSSAVYGTHVLTDCFTGNIVIDADVIYRYCEFKLDNPSLMGLIRLCYKTKLLDVLCKVVNKFTENHKEYIFTTGLADTLGTIPGYWALLQPDKLDEAKNFLFGDKQEEYAGLIEKIIALNEINSNREEILLNAQANGTNMSFIACYNRPNVPVYAHAGLHGDDTLETDLMAGGATVSNIGETLSSEYLAECDGKYLSPDKDIDCSTCLMPDYTWCIKDGRHVAGRYKSDFNQFLWWLMMAEEQRTIYDKEEYPQYIQGGTDDNFYGKVK